MRAVVQRCSAAKVTIEVGGAEVATGSLDKGLLVYLGVGRDDGESDSAYLADKIANLRIFMDQDEKMNLSALDLGLGALVVSQFTLYADARKGRRPSYSDAAGNEAAQTLYEEFCYKLKGLGLPVSKGRFGSIMRVSYVNEGPITILLDSKKRF
ncbi:MAG: D-aminoacyl-tRNA deacylase [Spirochaetes bacterium]|nr:D-aminoacyl-tRNA deacylase [Spirochaetota bacterium]